MQLYNSFLNYYLLCEKHGNVKQSVHGNVKTIIKSIAQDFKTKLGQNIVKKFGNLRTDYEYLVAGLNYLSDYAQSKGRATQYVFKKDIDIKIRSYSHKVTVLIMLALDCDGVHGQFTHDDDNLDMIKLSSDKLYEQVSVIRRLTSYLSHELMHCYQYLSKQNFIDNEVTEASESIPNSFSFLLYYLASNEVEAVLMSAYTQLKRMKRSNITYLNHLLRLIDFNISTVDNEIDDNKLTPQYLSEKYKKANDLNDLFVLEYFLGVMLPKTRFYSLCKSDQNYQNYISILNLGDLKTRYKIIEQIYSFLENKFSDKEYNYLPQAFYLISNKDSLNKLCSSTKYAQDIYQKITNGNFIEQDSAYDEEEDTIVYGRPDLNH